MARFARSLAVFTLGAGFVAAGLAWAQGPNIQLPGITQGFGSAGGSWFSSPEPAAPTAAPTPALKHHVRYEYDEEDRPARRKRVASTSPAYRSAFHASFNGKAVCVRLCDGSFFPATSAGAGDAGCAAQCPGAPTELYAMTSDRIDDSFAMTSGAPYSKLPVAKHFEASHENTCSCHREGVLAHAKELLHDSSLRKGDVVMTGDGFKVFEGSGWSPTKPQDFVLVNKAGLPREESAQLAAMEHASAGHIAPAAPPTVVAERTKGNVTVDDGPR